MSRINTNVQSLLAQRVLGQNQGNPGTSLGRLAGRGWLRVIALIHRE